MFAAEDKQQQLQFLKDEKPGGDAPVFLHTKPFKHKSGAFNRPGGGLTDRKWRQKIAISGSDIDEDIIRTGVLLKVIEKCGDISAACSGKYKY